MMTSESNTPDSTQDRSPFLIAVEVAIPGRVLGAIVRRLDARVIEAEALSRQTWGDDTPLAQHFMNAIAEALEATDAS